MLMMHKWVAIIFFFFLGGSGMVHAQDMYLSQFTNMAPIYNPAMTGMHDGLFKVSLLYQDHLGFTGSSIRKGVLFAEYGKDIESGDFAEDRLGIGGGFIYDDFDVGAFFNNSFFLNVAYLKSLTPRNNHKLGLGLQVNYSNRTIDYSRLKFETQFLEGIFDRTISSQETIGIRSTDYFDFQAGLMYEHISDYFKLRTGFAAYHLTQPKSSSINNFQIDMSLSAFVKFETWFKNSKHLYIDAYYRNKNMILSYYGVLARYTIVDFYEYNSQLEDTYLLLGLNVNSNLLVSPYIGWKSPSFEASFTFDIKVADINYFAYPFESFLEFIVAYKLMPNSKQIQQVGGNLY